MKIQQRVAFMPEYRKTVCQTVWGDGFRAGYKKNSFPGSNLRGDLLFPF